MAVRTDTDMKANQGDPVVSACVYTSWRGTANAMGSCMDTQVDEGLVFDVGAHLGEDSDFYLKLGYRVVAIEANPQLVETLYKRFEREIQQGRYVIVANAIGESSQQITFYVNKSVSAWGTTDPNWAARNEGLGGPSEQILVPCIQFEEVLRRHGSPVYLKIDIEGADMLCVHALESLNPAARPRFISLESDKNSWRDLRNEFDALERLGYSRYQVVNQKKHRDGRFLTLDKGVIDYKFDSGATGPFGTYLLKRWLTKRQALMKYIPIFVLYMTIGDNSLGWRTLRRVPVLRKSLHLVSWYDTHATRE